jgi:hypothetical protein
MRALNLHLPHPRLPHIWRPHPMGDRHARPMHLPVMGNVWALLLAAILAVAMLAGLWMSTSTSFHPGNILPL